MVREGRRVQVMKRKTTKELLAESFQELAETKPIDKITVKDITDNCGYSSATFYRQFKDKYDLIAWQYSRGIEEIMNRIGIDDYEWRQSLIDGAIHFQGNKEYLANLLLNTSGYDSFLAYMTEANYKELKRFILKNNGNRELDKKTQMYARLYCMGTVCLTCEWILEKFEATPEEMAEIYENSLPVPLHPYLLRE